MAKSHIKPIEEMSFEAGSPILLRSKKIPRFQIGGFAVSLQDNLVTLSYENPLSSRLIYSRFAPTKGNRSYKIKNFFEEIEEFKSAINDPSAELKKYSSLVGNLNVSLGDFIALGYNNALKVSGFILGIDSSSIFLSHQDPFFGDEEYSGAGCYKGPRQDITIGTRTYYLNQFNMFEILNHPAKKVSQEAP